MANPGRLVVPYFATKSDGIGIKLCRHIAESHGGALTLENQTERPVG